MSIRYNINMTKKIDAKRYLSVLIMLVIVVPGIFITAYGDKIGSLIGSIIYMTIGAYAIWEVLTSFGFNKYTSIIPSLSIIAFFLLKFNGFTDILEAADNNSLTNGSAIKLSFTWEPFVVVLISSIIPIALEPQVAKGRFGIITAQFIITFIMLVAVIFFKGLWALNSIGINPVVFILMIAILSDTFGYFGGKYLGNKIFRGKKLAPNISPKKTWVGAIIGFIFAFTFATLFGYYQGIWSEIKGINELVMSFIMALVLSVISPIGDLAFSAIKRKAGIKDFSNLLPGHGGLFDRIDALSIVTVASVLTYIAFI